MSTSGSESGAAEAVSGTVSHGESLSQQEVSSAPPSPPRVGRLSNISQVRRELARLYKEARCGNLPVADASRLGMLLSTLARILEGSELEARVLELEKSVGERR